MTDADMIEAMARAIGPSFIGNRMPDMSGDPLRKATPYERRRIDEAVVAALAVVRPEIDRLRAERDKAREYGAQARIRENEERAKFEEMRGRAEVAEEYHHHALMFAKKEMAAREAAEARADALAAKVEGMEKALKPFAKEAVKYDPDDGDGDFPPWDSHNVWTIGDLRTARAALGSGG